MNSNHYMQRLARAARRLTCAAGVRATMALLLLLVTSTTAWAQSLDGWGYQPVGQVENYEANHGSLTLSGWGLDPNDRDYSAPVAVIMKQDDVEKYNIQLSTNIYLSNSGGNATWRGYHGFQMPATEIDPGTYQLSVLIYNKPGTSGENQYATFSDNTTEKTITILPRQYTVTFHANYDGGAVPAPMSCADNITYPLPSMSRPGYTFAYWQSVDESDSSYDRVTNKSVELKAIWMPGTGTEVDPWRISSLEEWNRFVSLFRGSGYYRYTDTHVRLDTDLTLTKGVLINRGCDFDGNGHTLTYNYKSDATTYDPAEDGRAPFRYISGATIRNLTVAGSTVSTGRQMAGLVAYATGDNSISGCVVSASLTSRLSGDTSNGGFVAQLTSGSINFSGCAFNGFLYGTSAHSNGGFVGWSGGTLNFTDCLFRPVYVSMKSSGSSTFARSGSSTFTNTYYTTALGAVQGTLAYTTAQNGLCEKLTMTGSP